MKTLLTVPIHNEEPYVLAVLNEIKKNVSPATQILAINDGSTDGSGEVLQEIPGITVLAHPVNRGYGQTVIDGLRYALEGGFDAAITIDCDAQHDARLIPEFEKEVVSWDIVSGSRYLEPSGGTAPAERAQINRRITRLINDVTGLSITDAFCGFRAYRVEALRELDLTEPGYGMPLQLWIQVAARRLRVKEIPVRLVYVDRRRMFPGKLKDSSERLRYYLSIIEKETARYRDLLP